MIQSLEIIEYIAFDFWGVIAKLDLPLDKFLKENKINLDDKHDIIHKIIIAHDLDQINEKHFFKKISKIAGINIPYNKYRFQYKKGLLNKNLISIIKKLKSKYKIALLTNNNREYTNEYIYKPKLDKLFDIMVISYQVGYRKPSPKIYQALIENTKTSANKILFIDDDRNKLPEAEKHGMQTLVYKWGETDKSLKQLITIKNLRKSA